MEFDKFLAEKLHLSLTHTVSPEALEQIRRELGSSHQDDQDLES